MPDQQNQQTVPPPPPVIPSDDIAAAAPAEGSNAPPFDIPPVVTPEKPSGNRKFVATILGVLVLVGGITAGVVLVRQSQIFQEKAKITECSPPCGQGETCQQGSCVSKTTTTTGTSTGTVGGKGGASVGTTTAPSGGTPSIPQCGTGLSCTSNAISGAQTCNQGTTTIYCCPSGKAAVGGQCVSVSTTGGGGGSSGFGGCSAGGSPGFTPGECSQAGGTLGESSGGGLYCCKFATTVSVPTCCNTNNDCPTGKLCNGSYNYLCGSKTCTGGTTPAQGTDCSSNPNICGTLSCQYTGQGWYCQQPISGGKDCSSNCKAGTFCYNECVPNTPGYSRPVACSTTGQWVVGGNQQDTACGTMEKAQVNSCDRSTPDTDPNCTDKNFGVACTNKSGQSGTCEPVNLIPGMTAEVECGCTVKTTMVTTTKTTTSTVTQGATPTLPPGETAQCLNIKAFDTNWNQLSSTQLSSLKVGDTVRFTVAGQASTGTFDQARFIINGTTRPAVTQTRPGTQEFYDEYVIPAGTTNVSVNAQLHNTTLGWF